MGWKVFFIGVLVFFSSTLKAQSAMQNHMNTVARWEAQRNLTRNMWVSNATTYDTKLNKTTQRLEKQKIKLEKKKDNLNKREQELDLLKTNYVSSKDVESAEKKIVAANKQIADTIIKITEIENDIIKLKTKIADIAIAENKKNLEKEIRKKTRENK